VEQDYKLLGDAVEDVIFADEIEAAPVGSGDFELLPDSANGGILRVRQKFTRADSINQNARLYPRQSLQASVDEGRRVARAGAMLSERRHPDVVRVRGQEKYVANPENTTARVDDIEDLGEDGWVWGTRTILDTPKGRELADAYRRGNPPGVSVRWKMKGRFRSAQGKRVFVADEQTFLTVDDVDNPATTGAGEFVLLKDEVLQELEACEDEIERRDSAAEDKPKMNETLKRLREAVAQLITKKAPQQEVLTARTAFYDALVLAHDSKEDLSAEIPSALRLEADMAEGGYVPDRTPPTFLFASQVGNGGPGWGSEIERHGRGPDPATNTATVPNSQGSMKADAAPAPVLTKEEADKVKKLLSDAEKAEADKKRDEEIQAAVDSLKDDKRLEKLTTEQRDHIVGRVRKLAQSAESVSGLVDDEIESLSKILAPERLAKLGFVKGDTVNDPASANARVKSTAKPWMEGVDKILAAADDHCRATSHDINPDDPDVKKRREHNRKFTDRIVEELAVSRAGCDSVEAWFKRIDGEANFSDKAFFDGMQKLVGGDATTTSQLFNQPTIANAFIIQSFQDMQSLDFVQGIGPGMRASGSVGWEQSVGGIGQVLRVPVEYYSNPAGYGAASGTFDAGLFTPEGSGIDEGTVKTVWLSFAPAWRRIAASMTRDAIKAMGNGPANYGVVGRTLFHLGYDKSRRVDKGILDEMLAISDEYGAVTVAAESPSLANQSSYNAAGGVTVNLNPTKVASGAVVLATDAYATYGAGVVAGIRVKTRGNGTSAPYMGTAYGSDPIVRPRVQTDLNATGQVTTTTKNPITIGGAGAQVMGYLDVNKAIQQIPGLASPTYAVDWENGVVVFNAAGYTAAGWGNGAGVLTGGTATISYAYATNFDNFQINNVTLGTGITYEQYLNGLLGQFDNTAAVMGSAPRYSKPNLAVMSLVASTNITRATLFYQLNSPKGSELFPTPEYFGGRTGINMARINAPWNGLDRRILLTRKGSTKYGIDTPFELKGPYPSYDANGLIIAKEVYYGEENSVLCTPQVQDQSGNIINPVAKTIILR